MASYNNAYNQSIARRQHGLNVANLKNDFQQSLVQPLHGGDFWSDFGDGFMSVMKPIGQVASVIAPFLGAGESGGDMSVNAPYEGYVYGSGMSGGNIANDGIPPFNIPTNAGMSGGMRGRKIGCGLSGGDEISDTDHPLLNNPELQATMFLGGRKPSSVSKGEKKRLVQKAIADMLLQRQLMAVHGKGLSGGGLSGGDFDWSSLLQFAPLLLGLGLSGGGASGGDQYSDMAEFEPLLTGLGMSGGDFWDDIGKGFSDAWNWVSGNADNIGKLVDVGSKIGKAIGAGQSGGMYDKSKYHTMPDGSIMDNSAMGMGLSGGSAEEKMRDAIATQLKGYGVFDDHILPYLTKYFLGSVGSLFGSGYSGGAMTYEQNMNMADAMGDIFSGMGQSGGARGRDTRMNSGAVQLYKGGNSEALTALQQRSNVNQPYLTGRPLGAGASGGGASGGGVSGGGVSGGDFWSDLGNVASQVAPFLPLLGLGQSGGGASGGKKKRQTKQDKMNERLAMKIAHLQGKGLETTPDMEASNQLVTALAQNNKHVDGAGLSGGKRTSKWIEHVKAYAKSHGIKYGDALKQAKSTYRG
jgi:hypothetical protein|nr:MAG: hypothetical protein [Lake Baikal virophage 1]